MPELDTSLNLCSDQAESKLFYGIPQIQSVTKERDLAKMPGTGLDIQSYLIAASPPGFDIHYAIRSNFVPFKTTNPSQNGIRVVSGCASPKQSHKSNASFNEFRDKSSDTDDDDKAPSSTNDLSDNENGTKSCSPTLSPVSTNNKLNKKKVSFADDLGMQLEHIRFMTERPDSPPRFRHDFLSSLTKDTQPRLTDTPPLKLNFAQPASDYVAFRERLEHNFVSLENVILKDYNLIGTIKVKNIAFEKTVTVRYTIDSWESFTDIVATYVPTDKPSLMPFDTFSFEFNIDPKMDIQKKVQFAVVYDVGGTQYWDSNQGNNYEVVPSDWREGTEQKSSHNTTEKVVFGLHSGSWTQFCGWGNMDNSVPYW